MSPRQTAGVIAAIYLVLGLVWIRFSDQFVFSLAGASDYITELQTFKGFGYVIVTALLLYFLAYKALQRERNISQRDELTKLLNRHMFGQELNTELSYAREHELVLAVLLVNIDGFKQINVHAGLAAGDKYLQEVAAILRDSCHQQAFIARFNGDEFAIALPEALWPHAVEPLIHNLQQRIATIQLAALPDLRLSCSVGVALFPRDGEHSDALIDHAGKALDEAKSRGPGRYKVYDPSYGELANQRSLLLYDLRHAISQRQLSLVYQPQFCTDAQAITGVEVLVRWHHPQRGLVPPDQFIPLAEQHGLICQITDFVMQTGIRELLEHQLLYKHIPRVSFNVSATDFNGSGSCDRFIKNLAELPGDWSVIELELTESAALINLEGVKRVIEVLHDKGVQVSLDDFGTGYSSLNTLRLLPIKEVKIDQSFVQDITNNSQDAKLVRTILAMAKALHLRVVAEGVETHAQATYLKREGCEEFQGYLYARPMPVKNLVTFIENLNQRQRMQS